MGRVRRNLVLAVVGVLYCAIALAVAARFDSPTSVWILLAMVAAAVAVVVYYANRSDGGDQRVPRE